MEHSAETSTVTQNDERILSILERKILHRIRGPVCEGGLWRKRYDRDNNEPNIVNIIKSSRLRWAGHVVRADENELPENMLCTNPGGQRERGRPKSKLIDGVEEDASKLGCRNCLESAQDRDRWLHLHEANADDDDDPMVDVYDDGDNDNDDDPMVDVYIDVSAEHIASVFRVTVWLRWILKWLTRNECVSYMGRLEEIWPIRFPVEGDVQG